MNATHRVVVSPASGKRESLAVLALVASILAGSVTTVFLHRDVEQISALPEWQIDLRGGLNAAEQGITADLSNAAGEIAFLSDTSPEALADEGLPPFTADVTATARGGHIWEVIERDSIRAWLGRPARSEVARPMLLRLMDETPTVWITERADAPPADLDDASLIAGGWRMVVSRYDASVTRKDAH
ncbi:DUF6162 family protein [Paracoccus sp. KR1-242]|uniref:DUF6162 family protein n=1 Tax=Paracoccus sp. KR1-242 TaxID=3410028 RepID=UPI003C013504